MILDCITFEIDKNLFAIPTVRVVNIIEKPILELGIGKDGLLSSFISVDGFKIPILNLMRFVGVKNSTSMKDGYFIIVEALNNEKEELLGIHVDRCPDNMEVEDYQLFPYPGVIEGNPCFIAEAIVYNDSKEITLINIDNIYTKSIEINTKSLVIANNNI